MQIEVSNNKGCFSSMKSIAEILSDENVELLRIIKNQKHNSLKELSELAGRKQSNLNRTLKTLARHNIVELVKHKKLVSAKLIADELCIRHDITI